MARKINSDALNMNVINNSGQSSIITSTIEKDEINLSLPRKYNVIFHNDNVTLVEFVVKILCSVFDMSVKNATDLAVDIHHNGRGIAGTYIKSIAEVKVALVRELCQKASQPLKVTMEKA